MEPRMGLDAAEILVYSIALLLLVVMMYKISRWDDFSGGWVALIFLCIARLIGAGASVGDQAINTPWNDGVRSAAATSHGIGFALLLHSIADFIYTALCSMFEQRAFLKYFILINIPIFVTAIISSLGAGRIYVRNEDTADWRTNNLLKAAGVMYAILGAVQVLFTIYLLIRHKKFRYRERRVVVAVALCLPFAIAANVYLIATAFAGPSAALSPLSNTGTGVLVNALFTLVPDTAVLVIFYWTGCLIKLAGTNPEKMKRIQLEGANRTAEEVERELAVERRDDGGTPAYAATHPEK